MLCAAGYVVPKASLTVEQVQDVKDELTVEPELKAEYTTKKPRRWSLYSENDVDLTVPRFYGLSRFGPPVSIEFGDGGNSTRLSCTIVLRPPQRPIFFQALDVLRTDGGVVLACPTGFGKTNLALALVAELGLKTLVVVAKTFLADQWADRISQFLPDASVGRVQGPTVDCDGRDIVIAMLQSLATKTYSPELLRSFSVVIYDECVHVAAEVFCRALPKTAARYTMGLSATPQRKDGLTKVIHWFLGRELVRPADERPYHGRVVVQRVPITCEDPGYGTVYHNFKGVIFLPKMITDLIACDGRNDEIVSRIVELLREGGRHIIVMSDRLAHLDDLKRGTDRRLQAEGLPHATGSYTGKQRRSELEANKTCDVIFSTYTFSREGLDIPTLNALVLATPAGDVVQTVGRILRQQHEKAPIVIDIVDGFSVFQGQAYKRLAFYRRMQFCVSQVTGKVPASTRSPEFIQDDNDKS